MKKFKQYININKIFIHVKVKFLFSIKNVKNEYNKSCRYHL